ncbi:ankyrin repeat protein [Gigaspora margarita]|uniref:Ankyrin repeat protein n=1 Tax=Gigaspora margarita TaxID=4874 RepID=A0A8H4EME0_GIGMA|nr:ankyrin repeat protein [Gigaspora margarita]
MKDQIADAYLSSFRKNDQDGINSALARGATLHKLFENSPDDPFLKKSHLNLFSVYKNEDIWGAKPRQVGKDPHEDSLYIMPLPEEKRRKKGELSICKGGIEAFKRNWNLFTEGSLYGLDWNNIIVSGGSILACLLPLPAKDQKNLYKIRKHYTEVFASSDIDIHFYGIDEETAKKKMQHIYETVCRNVPFKVICVRGKYCVNIVSKYPYRHIQIVLKIYKTPAELFANVDIASTCVAYDGKDVWVNPRGHQALITQCNLIEIELSSHSYETRLAKYAERGFEIKFPDLKRDRLNPYSFQRPYHRLKGLARLIVLEKLPTPDERIRYIENRGIQSVRPNLPSSYQSRQYERTINLKISKFENNDYEIVSLPYGPSYDADDIRDLIYKKDMKLNSTKNLQPEHPYLHRHPCFVGNMYQIFRDCCGSCPKAQTPDEIKLQEENSRYYSSGELKFIDRHFDPMSPNIHKDLDEWVADAYMTESRENLCIAAAKGDALWIQKIIQENEKELDLDARDHFGRTPLQLAVIGGHLAAVQELIKSGAKITIKMIDGLGPIHLSAKSGNLDILEELLKKNAQNEKLKEQDMINKESLVGTNVETESNNSDESLDIINVDELDDAIQNDDKEIQDEEEETNYDIIDINAESWNHSFSSLEYAILFGHIEVVKCLIEAGANVNRRIIVKTPDMENLYSNFKDLKIYYPLGLCLLTRDTQIGLEIASILIKNGAHSSQFDYDYNTILHLAVQIGKLEFVKLLLDIDPKANRILNFLNTQRQSPLTIAVKNGNQKILELLLKSGAHASITLEDFKENVKYLRSTYGRMAPNEYDKINQPITLSLENGLWRLLIDAGVQINSLCDQSKTLLDQVIELINNNVNDLPDFMISDAIERQFNVVHIKSIISSEIKKNPIDSYVGFLLLRVDESQLNNTIFKLTDLDPINLNIDKKKLENQKLVEQLQKLDKSFTDLYVSGAQLKFEFEEDQHTILRKLEELKIKEGLLAKKQKHLELINTHELQNTKENDIQMIKNILESQIEILKQIIEHQNQFFTRIPSCQQIFNILKKTKDTTKDIRKPTSDDIYNNIISFRYLSGSSVPESLYEQYTTLFQAVWDNNTKLVERMSSELIIAVEDSNNMTPFILACYKGYENMAVQILKIAERQYRPKDSSDQETNIKQSFVSNYDLEETCSTCGSEDESEPELPTDIVIDETQDAKVSVHTITTAFELLQHAGYELSEKYELIPKNWKKQDSLGGFNGLALAVFMNHVKVIKEVLTWAESYQKVKDDKEDMTDIVMRLIRNTTKTYAPLFKNNKNNLMKCAIFIDNVDVVDLLIEYGAGGNSFGMFNIDRDDEIEDIIKNLMPTTYIGLDINGRKKKSWISRHDPYIFDQAVDPSFLHMAAYYGAIKSIEYFLSTRPIDALHKFSLLHCKNSNIRNLFFKDEEVLKIGRVLFWFYLPKADTPFHWAIKENKPESIKKLADTYKKVRKDNDETLEKILNQTSFNGAVTPFLLAVCEDNIECLEALLEVGADPSIADEYEWTALHHAAYQGNLKMLRFLFDKLDHNITQKMLDTQSIIYKHTPISIAILEGRKDTFHFLLERTANTSIVDFAYNNYLHLSVKESSLEITKTLLTLEDLKEKVETNKKKSGVLNNICRENSSGHTPVDIATNQFLKEIHDNDIFSNENYMKPKEQRFVLSRLDTYLNKNESRQSISCCSKQEEVEQFQPFEVFDLLQKTNRGINSQRDLIPFKDAKDMIYECISLLSDPGSYLIDKDIYAIPQIDIDIYKFSD